ncbi:MAG: DUF2304 family protein [Actinomycetota bacterium]
MGLRIFGVVVAALLALFAIVRYRKGQLRRGEALLIAAVSTALIVAGVAPNLLDPVLSALGFDPGQERRIIGLLVLSNLFTLGMVFRGFSRDDTLSTELGDLVDYVALKRLQEEGHPELVGSVAVVIPAYNEDDNIPRVLAEIPDVVDGLSVQPIVVADGCTDTTEATARSLGATVIRRDLRRGSGAAARLGYQAALQAGARVIVTLDADGQHDPGEMEQLVKPLLTEDVDMVQGSRILGEFEVESKVRKHGVRVFAWLLTLLGSARITDPSTGYRAMTAKALRRMDLRQDQFYVSELILDASRKGMKVIEVPITIRARNSGASKKPRALRYAWGFSKAIVRTWLR